MNAAVGLSGFEGSKYLSLETYRRSGIGVRTPVWFAAAAADAGKARLYVYTTADAGKTKRIRRSGVVRIAPCDIRGNVKGDWTDAHAAIVNDEEFTYGMRLLDRKYRPWKQILDLSVLLFPRHQRVMIAIWIP